VHACFVYLLDHDGSRLVLKAAGEPYGDLVDKVALEQGEGLAWWVADRKEPAFIREQALDDPRVKYVPELDEEKFQSLVSVPILGKDREAIGVITMHTEAPREFTDSEVDLLVSSASLVAGAIENARLYDEMRQRVSELEQLTELGEAVAATQTLDELLPSVLERSARLLGAETCRVYLLDPSSEQLQLAAVFPADSPARSTIGLSELARPAKLGGATAPLVANDELLGLLAADGTSEVELARAAANQVAVAIKKIELIERLTEKNLIKDFFQQLAAGKELAQIASRAERLGADLNRPHLVVSARPASDALERALGSCAPGSLFDRQDDLLRALIRVPLAGEAQLVEAIGLAIETVEPAPRVGVSNLCSGAANFAAGFEEARHALLGTTVLHNRSAVTAYDELGPYKYLLRMSLDAGMRDSHRDAVFRLAEYDEERSSQLLRTLEEFLGRRGNISATAEALYIHPNTLRQRLRRIADLTGLDLRKEDWLMVEIAVKLVALKQALRTGPDMG
ncbi:MAG: GAF domain-containing protein, partial [Actinomycetota bacterium]|nr:GAF domain-containing protein [Actinomycetota bacterium]